MASKVARYFINSFIFYLCVTMIKHVYYSFRLIFIHYQLRCNPISQASILGLLKVFTRNALIFADFDSMMEKYLSTNTRSSVHENSG